MFNILEVHWGYGVEEGGGGPACCVYLKADKQARIYEQCSWQLNNVTTEYIYGTAYKCLFWLLWLVNKEETEATDRFICTVKEKIGNNAWMPVTRDKKKGTC